MGVSGEGLRIVLVTGLSGSGKSTVVNALEDLGYYCIDNLPTPLLGSFLALCRARPGVSKVAIVVDTRVAAVGPEPGTALDELAESEPDFEVLYLEASTETLLRRYSETRRRHPLQALEADRQELGLREAIERERDPMLRLRDQATSIVDTSQLNVHELRRVISERFGEGSRFDLVVNIMSFGFKFGPPVEADHVFDVRYLPNPHFIEGLRPLTGMDEPVARFLADQPAVPELVQRLTSLLDFVLPGHDQEGRVQVTVAIGCTGGKHRSVFVAERLSEHVKAAGRRCRTFHRDARRP